MSDEANSPAMTDTPEGVVVTQADDRLAKFKEDHAFAIDALRDSIQFSIWSDAKREDVVDVVDRINEGSCFDSDAVAVVVVPRGISNQDAQEAVDVAFVRHRLAHTAAPRTEEVEREGCVGSMTAERATYFLERFKREEKWLGPHEQWALDYTIAALASLPPSDVHTIQGVPDGWKLVPIDLTYLPAMREAAWKHVDNRLFHGQETALQALWSAMLAATPTAPTQTVSADPDSWAETPEEIRERAMLLAEVELHLNCVRVFITSREKMHPCGVDLHDELVAKVTSALGAIGREKTL